MNKNYLFLLIIFFLYVGLVFFGIYHHEPWRDESYAWMNARENSISGILNEAKYIGTPSLWYIFLMPWAKLGFPYFTMSFLHGILAIAAVGMLLFFSRIPLLTKILFIFSYYMAYEYAVIARNYLLTGVLLFAIARFYSQRFSKPYFHAVLIALLFQINSLSFGIAAGLVIIYCLELIKERKIDLKRIGALGIMLASALFVYLLLHNPSELLLDYSAPPTHIMAELLTVIRNSIVPSIPQFQLNILQSNPFNNVILSLTFLSLVLFALLIWENKFVFLLTGITYGWFFYVNAVVHRGTIRHHGLLIIFLIFLWWISEIKKRNSYYQIVIRTIFIGAINILLFTSLFYTFYIYNQDYNYNFSGAKDMTSFIKSNNLEKIDTVLFEGGLGEAVRPYFKNKQFWYPEYGAFGYFEIADEQYNTRLSQFKDINKVLSQVKNNFQKNENILLILSTPLPNEEAANYTLLHVSQAKYFWSNETESFWLYRRNI